MQNLPALTINWGPWSDVGMAGDDSAMASILASIGVDMIPPDNGLQALGTAMESGAAQFVVVRIGWAKYLQQFGGTPPSLLRALGEEAEKKGSKKKKKKTASAGAEAVVKKLLSVPENKRFDVLCAMIQKEVMAVLGLEDASSLGISMAISEFGLDSMMSVELKNQLQDLVGRL